MKGIRLYIGGPIMPKRPDVRKRQFLRDLDWNEGAPKNPEAASVVEDRQPELLQTGGIADDVHPDDLPVREREARNPEQPSARRHDHSHRAVTIAGRANRAPREKAVAPLAQVCAPRTSVAPPGAAADGSKRADDVGVEDGEETIDQCVEPAQCRSAWPESRASAQHDVARSSRSMR